jgi:hypothetical protein
MSERCTFVFYRFFACVFFCPYFSVFMEAYVSDRADLQAKVAKSKKARVKDNSRGQYANSAVRFVQWLSANENAVLNQAWVTLVVKDVGKKLRDGRLTDEYKKAMKARLLRCDLAVPPLHFAQVKTSMFLQWIHSLSTDFDAASGHRSACKGLFKDYQVPIPQNWDEETGVVFQGLKREKAAARAEGKAKKKTKGKKPMEFGLYCTVSKLMWKSSKDMFAFNVIYMLLCWNLMARSGNVTKICFEHFDWKDDAMTILFCTTKTDQGGDRAHPRHIYANPFKPEICPILALGIYLMLTEFDKDEVRLFPGGTQYSHFSKGFKSWIERHLHLLVQWIKSVVEWGTHSFRKGSATFCCSGSSAGAHISAVSNRCGWKQPGVQDTYLVYADAGDQVVGRIVVGLPLDSVNFSILPPFFTHPDAEIVKRAVALCFPSLKGKMALRVLVFCLASIVYHRTWLRENVPGSSPLWNTALFRDVSLLNGLAEMVQCRLPEAGDDIRATGLPPHISQLRGLEAVRKEMMGFCEKIEAVGEKVTANVLKGLDERNIESHVTPTSLKQQISEALREFGVDKIVAGLGAGAERERMDPPVVARAPELVTYCWGGKLGRLLPEGYKLPRGNARDMWQLYIVGNQAQGIRPLKFVTAEHISDPNVKKRFRYWFSICFLFHINFFHGQ